jgi:uncharacterized protein with FMN-binding domain
MENKGTTAKTIGAVVITAMLFIGVYVFILNNKPPKTVSTATGTSAVATKVESATTTDTPVASTVTSSTYTDGTYKATGSYAVPHGDDNSVTVTLTIKDDTITAVNTTNQYTDNESIEYVQDFDRGISGVVVGKKLDNARVGRVNGSSLTGNGFNEALSAIISKAQAS